MSVRTGRNYRYDAAGNALTAGAMGLAGQYLAKSAIFLGAAALCIPALIALSLIRSDEIDYARARNAGVRKHTVKFARIFDLGKNLKLYPIRWHGIFLFQFADASVLPVISQELAHNQGASASLQMAGCDHRTADHCCTALALDWFSLGKVWTQTASIIGLWCRNSARIAIRAIFRLHGPSSRTDSLGGISAATVTVLTVLVIVDLTTGTGRFNLVQGFVGTIIALAASLSTGATGFIFDRLGHWQGFSDFGGSSGGGDGFALERHAGNKARQISRLKGSPG